MAKIGSLSTITTGYGSAEQLNNNFSEIRNAILNTLSLDGSTPNGMNADLDLNGQSLINAYSIQADTITIGGNTLALSTLQTLESISDDIVTVASNVGNIGVVAGDITNINNIVTNLTDVQNVGSNITAITTLNTNITNINTVATNIVNVNLTAENIADVNAVGQGINSIYVVDNNITDIQTLADIEDGTVATNALSNLGPISTDITTVAGSISNVTTVSGSITNVNTVAGSIANVNATGGSITSVNTVAGNILNVNTVAGAGTEVTTVAGISTDVSAVSAISSNVTTVAANIASVNTVATNIASVISVANDLTEAVSEVETVANDLNEAVSEIDTVATNIADVNTVGLNISDVTTVSSNIANVNTVAGVSTNVTTVAGISANVTTVAGIASDVTTVASDSAVINTVATAITDVSTVSADIASVITAANDLNEAVSEIETVAASITNVDLVGTDITNVNTVAASISNVNTTAGSITNVNTVSGSITNVNTVATNILDVTTVAGISSDVTTVAADGTDIGTVATNIANVNTVAGDISNVNTVATNITSVNDFFNVYRIGSTDPTTSLDTGDLFYNTTTNTLKVYTGTAWEQGVTAGSGFLPLTGGTLTGTLNGTAASFSGTVSAASYTGDGSGLSGINTDLVSDTTPQLGGNLDLNGSDITGTGNLNITGTVTADGLTVDSTSGATINSSSSSILNLVAYAGTQDALAQIQAARGSVSGTDSRLKFFTNNGTSTLARIDIDDNGDISFYEDTGTTAKFFWDASAESLGIGTSSPSVKIHSQVNTFTDADKIAFKGYNNQAVGVYANFQNTTTGTGFADGFRVGIDDSENAQLMNGENTAMTFSTNNTEAMRIDSSGNVGIGTSSPAYPLHVRKGTDTNAASGTGVIKIQGGASTYSGAIGMDATGMSIGTSNGARALMFVAGGSERMRIDSSGNLLVGTTDSFPGIVDTNTGFAVQQTGIFGGSVDDNWVMNLNRNTTDGDIVVFRKDGTTVGSIGASSASLTIATGDTGLRFVDAVDAISPFSATTQLQTDAQTDIGRSSFRFKDLYLSGGVYLSDTNTRLTEGTGNSVRVQTNYGYVDVGPQNSSWSHFQTDRPSFYFNKYLRAEGSIGVYGGTAYMDATSFYGDGSNLTNLPAATGISTTSSVTIEATASGSDITLDANDDVIIYFGAQNMYYDAGASEVRLSCRMEATEFEATSDINLKENIELLTDPLGKLSAISGYSYNFKDTGNASYGVIAQEVEKVLPDAVSTNAVGTKSVNYNSIVALLVETIKEQEKRIAALEGKVGV